MNITLDFKKAVDEKNLLRVKIMLKDSLLVDTSFLQFNSILQYVEECGLSIWDDDGEDDFCLPEDKSVWNEELMNNALAGLINSFTKKRVNNLKALISKLYPPVRKVTATIGREKEVVKIYKMPTDRTAIEAYKKIRERRNNITEAISAVTQRKQLRSSDIQMIRMYAKDIVNLCDAILEKER